MSKSSVSTLQVRCILSRTFLENFWKMSVTFFFEKFCPMCKYVLTIFVHRNDRIYSYHIKIAFLGLFTFFFGFSDTVSPMGIWKPICMIFCFNHKELIQLFSWCKKLGVGPKHQSILCQMHVFSFLIVFFVWLGISKIGCLSSTWFKVTLNTFTTSQKLIQKQDWLDNVVCQGNETRIPTLQVC